MGPLGPMGPMAPMGPMGPWALGPESDFWVDYYKIQNIIKSRIPILGTFLAIGDTNGPRDHSHQNRIEKLVWVDHH